MSDKNVITALKRGLQVLETFTPAQPRLTLPEITGKTGLPKPTVYRLLQTLLELDYLLYDPVTRRYQPTPRVMAMGFAVISGLELREISLPYLKELSREIDQNVNLGILDRTDVIYIERVRKRQILNIDLHVGSRLNVHDSSMGQAILAYLDESRLAPLIDELLKNPHTAERIGTDGSNLRRTLDDVRKRGFALNDEELIVGLRALGVPVLNREGQPVAAINVAAFSQMCSREELLEQHAPKLLETARIISLARGYTGPWPLTS